jgi:hypothetical protein
MTKPDTNLYYDLRHLKDFRNRSNNDNTVWLVRWPDGGNVEIYKKGECEPMLSLGHDITLAEYICDLHNLSEYLE